MRILDQAEFDRLLHYCPTHVRPIVITGYYPGMHLSEITNLTWDKIDVQKGCIRLAGKDTKTKTGRSVPLHPTVKNTMEGIPRALHTNLVFLKDGDPVGEFKRSYNTALRRAGIKDFHSTPTSLCNKQYATSR